MTAKAFFKGLDCTSYKLEIIGGTGDTEVEVFLDGGSPFTVTYNSPALLFEPSIISTATISIVHNNYLNQLYSPYAQGTRVVLTNLTDDKVVWAGYLKAQLYSQGYVEEYETIELEASDCLASLQYVDYSPIGSHKQIVSFKDIIDKCCDLCGEGVLGYYWPRTTNIGTSVLMPDMLTISEQNFYSSDSDEPWKCSEVLEEICRYLGLTVIQWEGYLYFLDLQSLRGTSDLYCSRYLKSNSYTSSTEMHLTSANTITSDVYMGRNNQISFEPIYNKATVKANFYYADDFIPDIFEEENLEERAGYQEILPVTNDIQFKDRNFTGNTAYTPVYILDGSQKYDADDSNYWYYRKFYDNKYYTGVFRNNSLVEVEPSPSEYTSTAITRNYIGANIVDFASIEKGNPNAASYELASNASFSKYLLISQKDKPAFHAFNNQQMLNTYVNDYPSVYELKPGYYKPVILNGSDSYLALFANAKYERYTSRDYINPDWTDKCSRNGNVEGGSTQIVPRLNFRLQIGDKYFTGSGWTTTATSFWVRCRTEEDENRDIYMAGDNWNKDRETLNNIPFTDWTGADGFKIPLDSSVDMNGEIRFAINMPAKNASITLPDNPKYRYSGQNNWCWLSDISVKMYNKNDKDTKDDVVYGGEDSGVIDENSVNELSEIEVKITTYPGEGKLSYSNVGYNNVFLQTTRKPTLSNVARKPEENIIEKFITQYSTQTIQESLNVDLSFVPFQKIYDGYWNDKTFVWNGTTIDFKNGNQEIKIVELK